jgi:hypothetical protein
MEHNGIKTTTLRQQVSEWILGKRLTIVLKEHEMLKIIDPGCNKHNQREFTLDGVEAETMGDILLNLPIDGESHTFICEHGHTHRISFNIQVEKLYSLSAMFSRKKGRSGRPKPEQAHANRQNSHNLTKG